MQYLAAANDLRWLDVLPNAIDLYEKNAEVAASVDAAIKDLPRDGFLDLWRNAGEDKLILNVGDWMEGDDIDAWKAALQPHCGELEVVDESGNLASDPGVVKIAFCHTTMQRFQQTKAAYSSAVRGAGQLAGYLPGGWADTFGGPTPLSGAIGGGLIGAGLGYGAGWLGEQVLPKDWRKGRLRKTLAIIGALGGAAPGGMMALDNWHKGRDLNSGALTDTPLDITNAHRRDHPDYNADVDYVPDYYKGACDALAVEAPAAIKEAIERSRTGFELQDWNNNAPPIPIDIFTGQMRQSGLPPQMQAATGGLLEASYMASPQGRSNGPRIVWPRDVARIAAGMGSGYMSGALVGKALGALVGMPAPAQQRLRNMGLWAGVVSNIVPLAFGR